MEQESSTHNNDLEKLLRQQLQSIDTPPSEDTWAQIAALQKKPNRWLRVRYFSTYAVPLAAALALILFAWWHFSAGPGLPRAPLATNQEPTPSQPAAIGLPEQISTAGSAATLQPNPSGSQASVKQAAPVSAGQQYGARVNSVPATTLRFQAESGLHYESPISGTSVRIPAGALVHRDGRPVTGAVDLQFREYRDIPDFLASGIPMHYADERGMFFFNSGGMFDIRVSQGGEQLEMAPNQSYDVAFAPTDQLTSASLYYFNEASGRWEFRPDPAFGNMRGQNLEAQPPIVSEAEVIRNNTDKSGATCLPAPPEAPAKVDPAILVRDAVLMGHELAAGNVKMPKWFCKNPTFNNEQLLNSMERGLIRIVRNRDCMEQFFPEDIDNVFTELKAFKDCYFFRSTDSSNILGSVKLGPNSYWQRVSIKQEKGNTCIISLYDDEKGLAQFYANLNGSMGNENFDVDKVFAEYQRLKTERQQNFEMLVTNLRRFLLIAPAFQTEREWCMTEPDWLSYFENNHPQMLERYNALIQAGLTSNTALALKAWNNWRARSRDLQFDQFENINQGKAVKAGQSLEYALKVSKFGLYNCDQIYTLGRDVDFIYAGYETADGQRIIPSHVSMLERNSRVFFTLASTEKVPRAPGRRMDIVVTGSNGRSYHLAPDKYAAASLARKNSNIFTLEDVTDKTRTPREWANLLEM